MLVFKSFIIVSFFIHSIVANTFSQFTKNDILSKLGSNVQNSPIQNNQLDSINLLSYSDNYRPSIRNSNSANSINEEFYCIGGGDEFTIAMVDRPTLNYKGSVDQNGELFLSGLGLIKLGKVSLLEAKNKIKNAISSKNRNKKVYVTLSKCKNVSVDISGCVDEPGRYVMPGTARILDALRIANNDKMLSVTDSDLRRVKCIKKDTVIYYDILKYINNGDLSQNPYLYPADNILLNPITHKVLITGAVKTTSNWVPVKPNEKLGEFLKLFRLDASADSEKVIIQTSGESIERKILNLNLTRDSGYILKDQDLVIIPYKKNYTEILSVSIEGEILKPGLYPIIKNGTKVEEVIEMAGNITESADIKRAVVIRNSKMLSEKVKIVSVRPEISSSLQKSSIANDYTVISLETNPELNLENNDKIFIPKIEKYVYVSGEVKRSGGIEYKPDKEKNYYIKKAGGYSRKADKSNTYVITKYGDVFQTSDGDRLKQGDIIVVPISQQSRRFTTIIVPLISVISTTLIVLLSAYNTIQDE